MRYYYNGQSLASQFPKVRYNRITICIKQGMRIEDAIKWTEIKHLWTPNKYNYNGKTCYEICKETGLNYNTFLGRVRKGWSIEDSLKIRKTKKQIEWEKTHGK